MYSQNCCLCLKSNDLEALSKEQKDTSTCLGKLREILQEINWLEVFMICKSCETQLNQFYIFRKKCIDSYNRLIGVKFEPKVEILSDTESEPKSNLKENELQDESDYSPSSVGDDFEDTVKKKKKKRERLPITCEVCLESFDFPRKVIKHCWEVHGMSEKDIKPYCCSLCKKRFNTGPNLNQHMIYHKERNYLCNFCGKSYFTPGLLSRHQIIHTNLRQFKCSLCQKDFRRASDVDTHNLIVHTDPIKWKYVCSVCEKRFPMKSNFDAHMRRHTGEKPFSCHMCEKSFATNHSLGLHLTTHSNVKGYKCDRCEKEFKREPTLRKHKAKVHEGKVFNNEKKFVCNICSKAYYNKHKLTVHLYSHSGEKPFSCGVCEKRFTDKHYLKQHVKNRHPETVTEESAF